jgi:hypothetical protein
LVLPGSEPSLFSLLVCIVPLRNQWEGLGNNGHTQKSVDSQHQKGSEFGLDSGLVLPGSEPLSPSFFLLVCIVPSDVSEGFGNNGHTQKSFHFQNHKGFEFGFGDSGLVLPGSEPLLPLFFFLVLIVP